MMFRGNEMPEQSKQEDKTVDGHKFTPHPGIGIKSVDSMGRVIQVRYMNRKERRADPRTKGMKFIKPKEENP